ncbi:WxcM-like domain-containing protein [Tamlana fucoidanivorans]|uniref:WxcM-like domain-containing protein n=1 Tax=Allotamlana fucoidanivorans TaxID=2583814 RepID=A0A5C4SIQ3_9FLAO|nr:FdtA/QdtA family cupin domain-containing protein [Tamlana fucoidanivorans]TNJ43582.1 WxcM-like domain-containing protein [Tamlana fucoidanivorans]
MKKPFYSIIDIPKIEDTRGNLGIVELDTIPFDIKRVYYLFDVPSSAYRGGHAHIEQEEFLIPVSGSFDVLVDDGNHRKKITLNKPDKGLLISTGVWRELENFSSGAVCLVISSGIFDEADYIRDYQEFLKSKR